MNREPDEDADCAGAWASRIVWCCDKVLGAESSMPAERVTPQPARVTGPAIIARRAEPASVDMPGR